MIYCNNDNILEKNKIQNNFNEKRSDKNINWDNSSKVTESLNMNTLESVTIKRIDEEEERRTMELEHETNKLNELEKEKMKLIEEEREIKKKILYEIDKQERKEKEEKRKRMKLKYVKRLDFNISPIVLLGRDEISLIWPS